VKKPNELTLKDCEEALGEEASTWKARCYEIASRIVAAKLVKGTAVYGHWLGPVHSKSCFAGSRPFVQHGWIVLPNDLRVIDPTRWVFEHEAPYLFLGEPGRLYDEGGNEWRTVMRGAAPAFDVSERAIEFDKRAMDTETWKFVERYLEIDYEDEEQRPGVLSRSQVSWIANAPLTELGRHARGVYDALEKVGEVALIPIDNFKRVMEGRFHA